MSLFALQCFACKYAWYPLSSHQQQKNYFFFPAYFFERNRLLRNLTAHGLRAYFILDYGNTRLYPTCMANRRANTTASPACISAFARFAVAAMSRYWVGGVVSYGRPPIFELWNEPNTVFWEDAPHGNATEYARLAIAVNQLRIAAGLRNQSEWWLVGPAVAGFGTNATWEWMSQCYQLGCLHAFDAVSVHAYRHSTRSPETVLPDYLRLKRLMNSSSFSHNRLDLPIISGEWGWSTCDPRPPPNSSLRANCDVGNSVADEPGQARFLARQWLVNALAGVPISIYYDWSDDCDNPYDRECRFGTVVDEEHSIDLLRKKPSYVAASTLQQFLGNATFVKNLGDGGHGNVGDTDGTLFLLEFEGGLFAAWNYAPAPVAGQRPPGALLPCPAASSPPAKVRENCGHSGTTKFECEQAGCCFLLPPPAFGPQCFFRAPNTTRAVDSFDAGGLAAAGKCWTAVPVVATTEPPPVSLPPVAAPPPPPPVVCADAVGLVHGLVVTEDPILLVPATLRVPPLAGH